MSMISLVAIIGLVSMLIASIPKRFFKYGLEVAWLIICVFLCLRYDFGNDYMSYMWEFENLNAYTDWTFDKDAHHEYGWQLLSRVFSSSGFFWMVAVLSIFECFVFYKLIKTYVPERYYWFSIFLFVFNPNLLLIGASMMRNLLAITLVVLSAKFIMERKIIPFVILIFLASQFHSSAIILYPLYLLTYIKAIPKYLYGLLIIAYLILSYYSISLGSVITEVAELAGEEETLDYYAENAVYGEKGMGIGILLSFYIFSYLVMTLHQYSSNVRVVFLLLIIGTFVQPFAALVPMIARYTYYFEIYTIVCYAIVWGGEKSLSAIGLKWSNIFDYRKTWRCIAIASVILLTLFNYMQFFQNDVWKEKYSEYHTIFEY